MMMMMMMMMMTMMMKYGFRQSNKQKITN